MARLRARITCFAVEIGVTLQRRFARQPEVLLHHPDLRYKTIEALALDFVWLEFLSSCTAEYDLGTE